MHTSGASSELKTCTSHFDPNLMFPSYHITKTCALSFFLALQVLQFILASNHMHTSLRRALCKKLSVMCTVMRNKFRVGTPNFARKVLHRHLRCSNRSTFVRD